MVVRGLERAAGRTVARGGLSPLGVLRGVGQGDLIRSGLGQISRAEMHHLEGAAPWPCQRQLRWSRWEMTVAW